jgi:hypothetical protein
LFRKQVVEMKLVGRHGRLSHQKGEN